MWFVVVCIALGAMTSVGVAWGLMLRAPVTWSDGILTIPVAQRSSSEFGAFRWLSSTVATPPWSKSRHEGITEYWSTFSDSFTGVRIQRLSVRSDLHRVDLGAPPQDAATRRALIRHEATWPNEKSHWWIRLSVGVAGWPCYCLAFEDAFSQEDADWVMSLSDQPEFKRQSPLRPTYDAIRFKSHLLPTFPLWPGLLANTAIYGGAWAVLIGVPVLLRRWLRARRGGCPQCGYSREGLKVDVPCPECGRATPSAHDATTTPATPTAR